MGNLIENKIISDINKARTGRYVDNAENRRLHRVGQEYENKGGREEDGKSFEKKDDNSRTIQALESKIEQMKKNKRIFVEQGGEARYNRALETLQSKLDSAKGEERKESVRDKASEKKEKTDSDYEKVNEASRKTEGKSEDGSDLRSDFKNKFLENPALTLTYSTLSDHGTSKDDLVGKEVAKQVMGNKKFKEKFRKELSALGYAKYLGLTPYKYESTGFADNLKDFSSKEIAEKLNVKDGETKEFSLKDSFIRTPGMGNGSLFSYDKMIVSMKNGKPTVTLSGKYQSGYKDNEIKDIKEGIGVLSKNQKETVLNLIEDKASEAGDGKAEEKEPFTRVKFDDLPNSGKVNLKKYLSGKRREKIDSQWKDAGKISDADLKKMEAGLVKKFNDSFDSSSKSQRAEDLYNIMKVKGELQKRGNETKKDGKTKSQENSKEKSMVMNISDDDLKVNSSLKSSSKRRAVLKKYIKS